MRLPLSWIKEYVTIEQSNLELESILTSMGLEVDSIENETLPFEGVVVAEVQSVKKHPNADKLVIAEVNDGLGVHQVVCGASNCREGLKTAFARVGAKLKDKDEAFEIKPTKIRGVESFGMLCALDELGIDDQHLGIIELPENAVVGESVYPFFGDTLFDISITPNLGHALCVLGISRELAAGLGVPLHDPKIVLNESEEKIGNQVSVQIENPSDCFFYGARLFKGLKVGPSPLWLKRRLEACGIRSINNVVDVTNYVMLELGQPLHAFDFSKVAGGSIQVRRAKDKEKILLLDEKERELNPHILVISDADKPIAVAGIMGGNSSAVTEQTQDILLEAAHFHPSVVRKGSKELMLSTDSSKRFERGIDGLQVERALNRAAMLLEEIAGGKPLQGIAKAGKLRDEAQKIACRLTRIGEIIGIHVSLNEVETIFKRLMFKYEWDGKNVFTIEVPSYRNDLKAEIDIIEEVARVIGYHNLPKKRPYFAVSKLNHDPLYLFEQEVRKRLIAEGLQECITCDLISPEQVALISSSAVNPTSFVSVLNPISVEQSVLRPSLIPGLLQVVRRNWDYQNPNIKGFEIGKIHFKTNGHFKEQTMATFIFAGLAHPHSWDSTDRTVDFFDLKGILENLFRGLRIDRVTFEKLSLPFYHPGRQAKIVCNGLELGSIGEVHPQLQRKFDIPERIIVAEISLQDLLSQVGKPNKMESLPLYPSSSRDWTVTVKEEVPVSRILDAINSIDSPYLELVKLKYIYRSDKLGEKKKNVTMHFIYRDLNETIENKTVDLEHARIVEQATEAIKMS